MPGVSFLLLSIVMLYNLVAAPFLFGQDTELKEQAKDSQVELQEPEEPNSTQPTQESANDVENNDDESRSGTDQGASTSENVNQNENNDAATELSTTIPKQEASKDRDSKNQIPTPLPRNEVVTKKTTKRHARIIEEGNTKDQPRIVAHSKPILTLYQGDKVELKVKAQGPDLRYRWIRNNQTICQKEVCQLDSSIWAYGKQLITLVVYNQYGSQSVLFKIKVLARDSKKSAKLVKPKLVAARVDQKIGSHDFYVRALRGLGYSKFQEEVRVIGQLPAPIGWDAKVKTHSRGIVRLGQLKQEEFTLFGSSLVLLDATAQGGRLIKLQRGAMRARQLDGKAPRWSIISHDWLQCDGDSKIDFILEVKNRKKTKAVDIFVLRGNLRVAFLDANQQLKKIIVPSGYWMRLRQNSEPQLWLNPPAKIEKYFPLSSSQYFLESRKAYRGGFVSKNIDANAQRSLAEAMIKAREYWKQRDAIKVIESLLPLYENNQDDYDVNLLLAKAYRHLGLYREALGYLDVLAEIDEKNPEAAFQKGLIWISVRKWDRAFDWFREALDKKHLNWQAVHYYLGVSEYHRKNMRSARRHFKYALWMAPNKEIAHSTREFLSRIHSEQQYLVTTGLGLGYDSNPYRWGKGERQDQYLTESGMFYDLFLDAYWNGFFNDDGYARLGYAISRHGYFERKLTNIDEVDQEVYADMRVDLGKASRFSPPMMFLNLKPYLGTFSFGKVRSADIIGIHLGVGFEKLWLSPQILLDYKNYIDPAPTNDDVLEPITKEPVLISDRSATRSIYGLRLLVYNTQPLKLHTQLDYDTVKYREKVIEVDNYKRLGLMIDSEIKHSAQMTSLATAHYFSREFAQSVDQRKDTQWGLGYRLRYLLTPEFYPDAELKYVSQSSNRDVSHYSYYQVSLQLSLVL